MRVVLFGATGMLGAGALLECLEHPDVSTVLAVGRRTTGVTHGKLTELLHDDFHDFSPVRDTLAGYDACFYCLGVSSSGMSEEAYRRVTVDVTLAAAAALLDASPGIVMCFVSGAGTDGSERGRIMWARVKGEAENRLLERPFGAVWLFRPGFVQPMKGVRSRTRLYRTFYSIAGPAYPLLARLAPSAITNTESLGLALIRAARDGAHAQILENRDINLLADAERARRA